MKNVCLDFMYKILSPNMSDGVYSLFIILIFGLIETFKSLFGHQSCDAICLVVLF